MSRLEIPIGIIQDRSTKTKITEIIHLLNIWLHLMVGLNVPNLPYETSNLRNHIGNGNKLMNTMCILHYWQPASESHLINEVLIGVLVMKRKSLPASRDRCGTVWQGLTNSHFSHHISRETYFTQEIAAPQKSSRYDTSDERQAQEPPETVQSSSPRDIKRTYACI